MLPSSALFRRNKKHAPKIPNRGPARDKREWSRDREERPDFGNYRGLMPAEPEPRPQLDLRRVRFAAFVERALNAARARGMTVPQIEAATKLGNSTFYSWRKGDWNRDPVPARVRDFCLGLGVPIDEAYRALGWSVPDPGRRTAPEPLIDDPDVRLLLRKLTSSATPAAEKLWIRRQIRSMAEGLRESPES